MANRTERKSELFKCIDCGRLFERKSEQKIRCSECQAKRDRNSRSKHMNLPLANKNDPNVCRKISTCQYRGKMGGIPICNYLEIMGHKRPCDVKNCTVYKKGKSLSRGAVKFFDE